MAVSRFTISYRHVLELTVAKPPCSRSSAFMHTLELNHTSKPATRDGHCRERGQLESRGGAIMEKDCPGRLCFQEEGSLSITVVIHPVRVCFFCSPALAFDGQVFVSVHDVWRPFDNLFLFQPQNPYVQHPYIATYTIGCV